ncbi:ABC transporter ATP-binding protein [Azospirillum sp. TSH7]|uniref:ABC transporter ATP-binding protein/permease n=1 Tax=unclassified Azospirillum TaxID=2630922 RepID=UPI000D614E3B|nr:MULTISPECIES: ABC transporter ATP-binding protein/permease [unclassified Azospirillum]PWC53567.1 ABC transporter ATP-binding protein [Azospirillum sp. TSH7]PWC56907.1 ABC transporter ATP-binding protein [Azospirillum sp. TSH20]
MPARAYTPPAPTGRLSAARHFLSDVWRLTKPYWSSEEKWAARGLLAAIVVLNLAAVFMEVWFTQINADIFNALQEKDQSGFIQALLVFGGLALVFIAVAVYRLYLNQMLQIRWRRWLTERYLGDWLENQTYYRLQFANTGTDNPDQRIAEDLRSFVQLTLSLSLGFLTNLVSLVSFLAILWSLSGSVTIPWLGIDLPGYMVWVALVYAVAGTWITHRIGKPLARLSFDQQRYEADFRFALVRLRENAESVALQQGEAQEARGFGDRFARVVANWWSLMRTQKRLVWFTSAYGQIAVIFPLLVAAPRYFSGALPLGSLMQTSQAFGQVQGALSWFIDAYVNLADWHATTSRLTGFHHAVQAVRAASPDHAGVERAAATDGALTLDGLALTLPTSGTPLVRADLTVQPGDTLLITGPSGSGKSTILRAIAGIWPFGRGRIALPAGGTATVNGSMVLPQKPYLPIGTLRATVTYPAPPDAFEAEAVREVLDAVGMAGFADRLDEEDHWSQRLSGGEQQRIAIARALLHRPDWLYLDEATSACDPETEERLYGLLRARLPGTTLVSVGHRPSLAAFHERRLTVRRNGDGIGDLAAV